MSAQNIITNKIVERSVSHIPPRRVHHGNGSGLIAMGFVILVLTIVIMTSVLIYMCLSGSGGESMLLLGVFPFTIVFILLLLSR